MIPVTARLTISCHISCSSIFDGSAAICQSASELIGKQVRQLLFSQLDYDHDFDGIWASASLLHIPSAEIQDILMKLVRALKIGGYLYFSFKEGDFEGERNGRYFVDYSEARLRSLCDSVLTERASPRAFHRCLGKIGYLHAATPEERRSAFAVAGSPAPNRNKIISRP